MSQNIIVAIIILACIAYLTFNYLKNRKKGCKCEGCSHADNENKHGDASEQFISVEMLKRNKSLHH